MPRQQVPCIFCAALPCECNGKPEPKKASRAFKAAPSNAPVALPESESFPADIAPVKASRFGPVVESEESQEDLIFKQAVRTLAEFDMLTPADRKRYESIIQPRMKAEAERELLEWRRKRG